MTINQSMFIYINLAVLAIYLVNMAWGYKKGFILQLIDLIGFIFILYIGYLAAPVFASLIVIVPNNLVNLAYAELNTLINSYLNILAWYIIITVCLKILLNLILKPIIKLIQKLPLIKQVNSFLGVIFSVFISTIWVIIISLCLTFPYFKNGSEVIDKTIIGVIQNYATNIFTQIKEPIENSKEFNRIINDFNNSSEQSQVELKKWIEGIIE